jgi:transposase InsO family protein
MCEYGLQPKRRRRFVITTDSDHNGPIFPNLARDLVLDGPNQLWVADLTYIPITAGFVYLAAILDAWSRRVVGYSADRSTPASLRRHESSDPSAPAATGLRSPLRSPLAQYASEIYRTFWPSTA